MAKQTIDLGSTPNDGTGTNLRAGGDIINDNFGEIYTILGNGTNLSFDLSGITNGQALVYNSSTTKLEAGNVSSTFTLAGDGGSNQTISGGDTLTIAGGTGISTSGSATDTINIAIDSTVLTNSSTHTLTNKTINSASNTITITESNISDLGSYTTASSTDTLTNKTIDAANNTLSNIGNSSLSNSSITINGTSISLGNSGTISAGTDWQAGQTANFNAAAGAGYFVDTTSNVITATLPASPTIGDEISFIDVAGTFDTNNFTVGRNGKPIQGAASDLTVSVERAGFTLVFYHDTQGWVLKNK